MALIKCKECGHEVSDKASTCPNCGCPIEKGFVCKECGNPISTTDAICPNCGCPIKENNSGFKWKKSFVAFAVLLSFIGGCYGIWSVLNDNTTKEIRITQELADAVHRYDEITEFHEGYAAVYKNGRWGYINSNGDEVIPCKYYGVSPFSEGLACVYVKEDYPIEFIDKKGKTVIKGFYGYAINGGGTYAVITFKDGVCCVADKEHNGVWINKNGNITSRPKEQEDEYVNDGTVRFDENGKVGAKDSLGHVIVSAKYSFIGDFSEGVALAYLYCGEKTIYGFVDKGGKSTFFDSDFNELAQYENDIEELKAEKRKEEEAKQAYLESERKIEQQRMGWLYGTWTYSAYGSTAKVVISDDIITVSTDGNTIYNGSYEIRGNELHYNSHNGMSDYIIIDSNTHRLMADERSYFNKVSSGGNNGYRKNPSNSSNENSIYSTVEGRQAYLEVLQLQKEVRALIDRSAPYRSIMKREVYGSYNYQTARMQNMDILNAAIQRQEKALRIARNKLYDESLIRELSGQLETLNKAKYSD